MSSGEADAAKFSATIRDEIPHNYETVDFWRKRFQRLWSICDDDTQEQFNRLEVAQEKASKKVK